MKAVKKWLKARRDEWGSDFIGIAVNTAAPSEVKEIRWVYTDGTHNDAHKSIRLRVGRGIAGMVWKTARPQCENQLQAQPEKLMEYPISRTEKLEAALAVPILSATGQLTDEVIGVLMIGFKVPQEFNQEAVQRLTEEAKTAAVLLQKEEATHDVG